MVGKVIKHISPSDGNPRNSEGSFYKFNDGKIIFIYSRYRGNDFSDHATCDLYKMTSYDDGETFSNEELVFACEQVGGTNIMSVSLIGLKNGSVGMFFGRKEGDRKNTILFSQSSDGDVWTEPKIIFHEEGYHVLNNDRLVRLNDGRLAVLVAYHQIHDVMTKDGPKMVFEPGIVYIYTSDDDESFYRTSTGYTLNNCASGLQEPLVIQHKDGRVECYSRTDNRCQYVIKAKDKKLVTWTEPKKTVFDGPTSPLSMKYIDDDTILAVWSSYPPKEDWETWLKNGSYTYYRSHFVCSYSKDGGKTFSKPKIIEYDLERGYCYCAIFPVGDSVLLAYCSGGKEEKCCLNRITIRKIKKSEIFN